MILFELSDMIKKDIEITYCNGQSGRFVASMKSVEIMENGMLEGAYGNGQFPDEALSDYAKKLSGKKIAVDAMKDSRMNLQLGEISVEYKF